MVVLVSFALVLAAAVTLVVGLLQSGLTLIYVSIACSVVAGLVLALAVLRGRPEPKPATAGRPAATPAAAPPAAAPASTRTFERPSEPEPEPEPELEPATVGGGWGSAQATTEAPSPPPPPPPSPRASAPDATQAAGAALLSKLRRRGGQPQREAEPEPVAVSEPAMAETVEVEPPGEESDVTARVDAVPAAGEGGDFPIPDYDKLRATEIIGQLDSFDRAQLEAVREREAATKNRFTVMNRIDARLAEMPESDWETGEDEWEQGAAPEPEVTDEEFAEVDVVVESDTADAGFPIPDYEALRVSQILPLLSTLSPAQREQVRQREEQGRARSTILDRIRRLDSGQGSTGAIVLPPAAPAPAKRSARKSSGMAQKGAPAPARKAPGRKVAATPVKKAAAAAAQKAVTKVAPSSRKATPAATTRKAPTTRKAAGAGPAAKRSTAVKKATKRAR